MQIRVICKSVAPLLSACLVAGMGENSFVRLVLLTFTLITRTYCIDDYNKGKCSSLFSFFYVNCIE